MKKLSRITKAGKHQIYQPGFNNINSCWLDGKWITLPEKEWKKKKAKHEKLYANMAKEMKTQHYRDKGTALKNMTDAQRQAWEFSSGSIIFDCIYNESGYYSPFSLQMAGKEIQEKSLKWFRSKNAKIIKNVKHGNKVGSQIRGLKIPKDLILDNEKTIDTVKMTIKQNNERQKQMFDFFAKASKKEDSELLEGDINGQSFKDFSVMMAVQHLIELETQIIRAEWHKSIGKEDHYTDIKEITEEYVRAKRKAKKDLGNKFQSAYEDSRNSHNECARNNLDNSDGKLYAFVLPKFRNDGTHYTYGERDVPWNNKE